MRNFDYKARRATTKTANTTDPWLFKRVDDTTKSALLYIPAKTQAFRVSAGGTATAGTTSNYTAKFFWGDATTTVLAATNAGASNSASGGWFLEATCVLDTVNSKIHGFTEGYAGSTPTVNAGTISTDLTSQTTSTVDGKAISVGGVFSGADAGNTATCDFFQVEVLAQQP